MNLEKRISAFCALGDKINQWLLEINENKPSEMDAVIELAFHKNGWFVKSEVINALTEISLWLNKKELTNWCARYDFNSNSEIKTVGVIMAGNIPLVGFHDYLSVLISGHKIQAKLSSKDEVLLPFLNAELVKIESDFEVLVDFTTERFNKVDAVIATGSDNSSRYFDYYFSKIPNIIRKNRTSVAVLTGKETKEELAQLGHDIFRYFGLGCRNVTKVYFPKGFSIDWFYEGIISHSDVINNHKYQNNYDYHKSLFLLNGENLWDNNFVLLKKDSRLSSPVGTLYYEEYDDLADLEKLLIQESDNIQCRVGVGGFKLGVAQQPKLSDYSDNIDVLKFLLGLS
tara:strand:- start:32502 stop:33527 length:1026 start_codon:yes stop_codon:yes gene_type:complete